MSGQNRRTRPSKQIDSDIRSKATERSDIKMKITDLTIDCLEEIFEYLDLSNLLNVADSNKRLNRAACFVFRSKHGRRQVKLVHYEDESRPLFIYRGIIYVIDRLRFLRCFGCVTSNLKINFYKSQVDKICFYVNEYCAESLIKLHILGSEKDAIIFTHLQRPFVNIEMVSFKFCHLGTNVMQFNKWFPKMRHLELCNNEMIGKECIEMNFPNLRYLSYRPKIWDNEHFENIIRLNPNLRILNMRNWGAKILQHVIRCVPQLEELIIDTYLESCYGIGQVHFKSLKKFEIESMCSDLGSKILSKIDFSFDHLEEFHVGKTQFNHILTFVEKCSTIKKLNLKYFQEILSKENVLQIAKALPLLSELQLFLYRNVVDEAIYLLDELDQVKKFHFGFQHQAEVDDLRARLGSKWQVSIDREMEKSSCCKYILLQRAIK